LLIISFENIIVPQEHEKTAQDITVQKTCVGIRVILNGLKK